MDEYCKFLLKHRFDCSPAYTDCQGISEEKGCGLVVSCSCLLDYIVDVCVAGINEIAGHTSCPESQEGLEAVKGGITHRGKVLKTCNE